MGEASAQQLHGAQRAARVGQGDLHPVVLVGGERGVGQELLERAGEPGQPTRDRGVDPGRRREPTGVEVDEPRPLGLVGLGEGVGQRGAGVAQPLVEHVGAVEVAEGGVVDAVEEAGRDPGHPADADVALGLRGRRAGDEGMRQHHAAGGGGPRREVGPDPRHRLGQRCLVAAAAERPGLEQRRGVEVGDRVDRHVSVLVGEHDRSADRRGVGADEDARGVHQARSETEAPRAVVVAAAHHDARTGGGEPGERIIGQADRVDMGERTVVDVSRDHDHVDGLRGDHLEEVVDERTLVAEQVLAVEGPPQVPVGGVEDAHGTTVDPGTDRPVTPRREGSGQ